MASGRKAAYMHRTMALTIDTTTPEARARLKSATESEKKPLIGLSREQLAEALGSVGVPERQRNMRVRQPMWSSGAGGIPVPDPCI